MRQSMAILLFIHARWRNLFSYLRTYFWHSSILNLRNPFGKNRHRHLLNAYRWKLMNTDDWMSRNWIIYRVLRSRELVVGVMHEVLLVREANSHVDSVTPFRSMILSCQRSPYLINIQLRWLLHRNSCFLCVTCQRWWAVLIVDFWSRFVTSCDAVLFRKF